MRLSSTYIELPFLVWQNILFLQAIFLSSQQKNSFRERFKHEVFPRLSRNELFIYSLFFLNVNISIIANTDAPIARIGMNRFVSSPVAGAESERGTLSSTIDVFFDALLFLAADADESGVLSS